MVADPLRRTCPVCDASAGMPCTFKNGDYRKTPHAERGQFSADPTLTERLRKRRSEQRRTRDKLSPPRQDFNVAPPTPPERSRDRTSGLVIRRVPKKH